MKSLLSLSLCAAAVAQAPVCLSGTVQPVGGPTICMQGETHRLVDTSVLLKSSTVNLNQYVGQLVRIEGRDIGLVCNVIDVTAVTPTYAQLAICGTPMPGCQIKVKVGPGAIGQYAILASFGTGFLPIGCAPPDFVDGTMLLRSPALTLVVAMFPGPYGELVWQIPNQPSLQGVQIWFQGARQDVGPVGPVQLTNSARILIVPFMPPCGGINC